MAKSKMKKGQKMSCVPCGREIVINSCGISRSTIWCCGRPMKKGTASPKKKAKKR